MSDTSSNEQMAAQYRAEAARLIASDYYDSVELLADLLATQAENAKLRAKVQRESNLAIEAHKRYEVTDGWLNVARGEANELRERLRQYQDENAAMREIVQAVAKYDATYCGLELGHECAFNAQQRARSGGQYFGCHWNKGEADRTRHMFIHGPACPVTKARALLGMKGE